MSKSVKKVICKSYSKLFWFQLVSLLSVISEKKYPILRQKAFLL